MCAEVTMGFQIRSKTKPAASKLTGDDLDRLEFIQACFALSSANRHLAVVGGEPFLAPDHIGAAMDDTLPVLESIGDRLDAQAKLMREWDVAATGRNEIILRDAERNRLLIEDIERKIADG